MADDVVDLARHHAALLDQREEAVDAQPHQRVQLAHVLAQEQRALGPAASKVG